MSESEVENERPRKMADLGPRKFEGIGPTTRDGMPIVLRSVSSLLQSFKIKLKLILKNLQEVNEDNKSKWYQRMYNTLHKAKDDGELIIALYIIKNLFIV